VLFRSQKCLLCVLEKLKYTVSNSSPSVHGREFQSFQSRIKSEQDCFGLTLRHPNCDFWEPKPAGLHPNLNYILTFEMTLKASEGKEHSTVMGGVAMTGV
jgi:hypothetical protein